MSTETSTRGERTTCDDCGLPYYADENDACPYCQRASRTKPGSAATGPGGKATEPSTSNANASEREPSLLRRLSKRVRDMLGSV